MMENPDFNTRREEELRNHLEGRRRRFIKERAASRDDRNIVFHVFTFGDPANNPARTVAHLRASLFAQDVRGSIFEGTEKNAFIVDVGIMTDSQYQQYQSQQAKRDQRLSDLEASLEDEELRRLKAQAGRAVQSFPFVFSLLRDLRHEEAVKSTDEMLQELRDIVVQAGFEECGPIFVKDVYIDPLRSPHFIEEVVFDKLVQAIRESISPPKEPPI